MNRFTIRRWETTKNGAAILAAVFVRRKSLRARRNVGGVVRDDRDGDDVPRTMETAGSGTLPREPTRFTPTVVRDGSSFSPET